MKFKYIFLPGILSLLIFSQTVSAKTILIIHPEMKIEKATRVEIANLFLGKATQLSGGQKAKPVDQKKSTEAGKAFLVQIVQMTESQYKNHWVEKMLSGEAEPIKVLNSDEEVLNFVKENKGAVGYINAASLKEGVKTIPVDDKSEW